METPIIAQYYKETEPEKRKKLLDQAIESYTSKAAYTLNLETKTGTLAEGYYADFVVLDKDLSKEKVEDIDKVKVMMTVVNGETVFER